MSQTNQMLVEKSDQMVISELVNKFLKTGFESYSGEDLALCVTLQDFPSQFKLNVGIDWKERYEKQALDKIHKQNIDISWIKTQQTDQYNQFFNFIVKGDFSGVKSFIRAQKDINYLKAVDSLKRSPLHLACKEQHESLVEFFINKGFDVNARDKNLKTPAHYASLTGNEKNVNILIKNGTQPNLKDKTGANCFHYACSSSSANLIKTLINLQPDLIQSLDNDLKTGLFYVVWNSSNKLVEMLRILIESNSNINHKDINKRTPLHHCSLSGNSRAIPILCQKGASITERDKDGKTPLDVCLNDRIREMIKIYSKPKNDKKEMTQLKQSEVQPIEEKPQKEESNIKNQLQEELRNKFYLLMKQIQENGILDKQHLKLPYIYTGSWMEGVSKIEDLYERIIDIKNPCEALLRAFNILCPYQQQLPNSDGNERSLSYFYGNCWFEKEKPLVQKNPQAEDQNLNLQQQLQIEQSRNLQQESEIKELKEQISQLQKQIQQIQQNQKQLEIQNQQMKEQEQIFQKHEQQLTSTVSKQENQISDLKEQINGMINYDSYQVVLNDQEKLKQKFDELQKNTIIKSQKIGKIFLNAINHSKQVVYNDNKNEEYIMSDDDSIMNLFKSLRNNPPSLKDRMFQVNQKKDGNLTQSEFTTFLQILNLNSIDIQGILRVCGFFHGVITINLDQFQQILQERPLKREAQEKKLFQKVIEEIEKLDISFDKFFQLLDTNGDKIISLSEIREIIFNFKLSLTQKDTINLFSVLDKEQEGQFDLQLLEDYIKKHQIQQSQDKIKVEKKIIDYNDYPLDGFLKIQIPNLGLSQNVKQIKIKIKIDGEQALENEKLMKFQQILKYSQKLQIKKIFEVKFINKKSQLKENIEIQIFDEQENMIGNTQINWKICLQYHNQWQINQIYDVEQNNKVVGKIAVQIKWINLDLKEFKIDQDLKGQFLLEIGEKKFKQKQLRIQSYFLDQYQEMIVKNDEGNQQCKFDIDIKKDQEYYNLKILIFDEKLQLQEINFNPKDTFINKEQNQDVQFKDSQIQFKSQFIEIK